MTKTIQTTVNDFLQTSESAGHSGLESPLTKMQDDVNKILVKLDELSLGKAKNDTGSTK
jgi:hypothetical protein